MVIYTETNGVFFSNDYTITGNIVKYRNLKGTVENDLFCKLKNVGEITLNSYNTVLIGSESLDGDIGVLLFE